MNDPHAMRKPAKVTSEDVDNLLARAAILRDSLTDVIVLIGAGHCEPLHNPLAQARRCMSLSRVFADAASHFLCRAELQGRSK